MCIPDKYKVDRLFLLVGENPLPNYVAARTLLKDNGVVYLVYTKQTRSQKDCLKSKDGLSQYNISCQDVDLADNESNPFKICEKIKEKLKSIPNGTIGLNYTGGTKAMAVHTYRAIEEQRQDTVFSYLDPRQLKMWIHQGQEKAQSYDICISLQLSLEEIFKLHGKYLLTNFLPEKKPVLVDLVDEICKLHQTKESEKKWKKWCNNSSPSLSELDQIFPKVSQILQKYLQDGKQLTEATKQLGFSCFSEFKTFLDGTWLENYVLNIIQNQSQNIGVNKEDIQMSFNITEDKNKIRTKNKQEDAKFEFDVAFIKGYQLFAISCTTKKNKSDCKEKLFEAYLRARELGGDEAIVALVCCSDEPWKIEEEFTNYGIKNPKIKVFGRNDLKDLANGILDWIDLVNQEKKK